MRILVSLIKSMNFSDDLKRGELLVWRGYCNQEDKKQKLGDMNAVNVAFRAHFCECDF